MKRKGVFPDGKVSTNTKGRRIDEKLYDDNRDTDNDDDIKGSKKKKKNDKKRPIKGENNQDTSLDDLEDSLHKDKKG